MTQTRLITTTIAVLLVTGLVGAAVAPAAATHNGGESDTIADAVNTSDDGAAATVKQIALGFSARASYRVNSLNPFSEPTPASEHANDTTEVFNQNSAELVDTANQYGLPGWFEHYSDRSNNVDVVKVTFTDENGGEEARYLVAQYNASTGEYESAEMTTSTDYTADSYVDLNARASQNAPGDLETFVDEYATTTEEPPKSYRRGLAVKYGGDVDSPLIPDVGLREIIGGL